MGPSLRHGPVPARHVDAVALLEHEHRTVRELLGVLLRPTSSTAAIARAGRLVVARLWIHLQTEEEIFYPALAESGSDLSEVSLVRKPLRETLALLDRSVMERPDDVEPLVQCLLALHEHESRDEERNVFPDAKRLLSAEQLYVLADRMRARRRELRIAGEAPRSDPSFVMLSGRSDEGP
jgi:hypothetical protein